MSLPAIQVEKISKAYTIAKAGAPTTFRDLITETVRAPFRRRRDSGRETVWALKNVSFEVKPGEAVGVLGANGAGKSTLLKILARITEPTEGKVTYRGRVGSLLEVGTGFHPELTGRQNIYLNGAILGMSASQIRRRLDEIVSFAEISRFLDEPVKHYSSGMRMRLAFAVAAHLEAEILLIDEVLAVGDVAFQNKCMAAMSEATRSQRTVLFVSHNVYALAQLTKRSVFLKGGECAFDGPTSEAIQLYLTSPQTNAAYTAPAKGPANRVLRASVVTSEGGARHIWGKPAAFEFEIEVNEPCETLVFSFQVVSAQMQPINHFWFFGDAPYRRKKGRYVLRCHVPKYRLYEGKYSLVTWLAELRADALWESLTGICSFETSMLGIPREYPWRAGACAYIEDCEWTAGESPEAPRG